MTTANTHLQELIGADEEDLGQIVYKDALNLEGKILPGKDSSPDIHNQLRATQRQQADACAVKMLEDLKGLLPEQFHGTLENYFNSGANKGTGEEG